MNKIENKVLESIKESKYTVVFTGAGISVESGIPPFRGKDGLWTVYDPDEYATKEAFERNPIKVWNFLAEGIKLMLNAKPNPAHITIAKLEELGYVKSIITQNIDNLHQKAGSKNVIELHGNIFRLRCTKCEFKTFIDRVPDKIPPYCPRCKSMLRPDIVLFGELLPGAEWNKALIEVNNSDVFLVVGTSGVVMPAASLPLVAKSNGAFIIEVNPDETIISMYADISIREKAGIFFEKILRLLK